MHEPLTLTSLPCVDGHENFERSFDFSKFPNLREVDLGVSWTGGGLPWIPMALSTFTPITSPCLSVLQLNFVRPHYVGRPVHDVIEVAGKDLRWMTDEVTRIEHEFEGAVNLTVFRDPEFGVVFDTLNVRFRFCGTDDASWLR